MTKYANRESASSTDPERAELAAEMVQRAEQAELAAPKEQSKSAVRRAKKRQDDPEGEKLRNRKKNLNHFSALLRIANNCFIESPVTYYLPGEDLAAATSVQAVQ